MDGELGLDLEARGEDRQGLGEDAVEGAVASHHVVELEAVQDLDEPPDEVVAEAVEGPLVLLAIGAVGQAVAHHVVCHVVEEGLEELGRLLGRVGVVAVDHEVVVGVDVPDHLPHDIALALTGLEPDVGAVGARYLAGPVAGVVVVDPDVRLGEHPVEVVDHLAHGELLVVARHQHCDRWVSHMRSRFSFTEPVFPRLLYE